MRALALTLLLFCCACRPPLEFQGSLAMTPDEMLNRADLVFVGVITKHFLDPPVPVSVPGAADRAKYWQTLKREVRVETVLRGTENRKFVDVFEVYWTAGATGNSNATHDGERELFLVRKDCGRYRVVRDWWRSIFPVTGELHRRMPLDNSRPLWERIALMNWWYERFDPTIRTGFYGFSFNDPGRVLSQWRVVKLMRGLLRHPSSAIRVAACRGLLNIGTFGQDECWETLSDIERELLPKGQACCTAEQVSTLRREVATRDVMRMWNMLDDLDSRRLLTAMNNKPMRKRFCDLWGQSYSNDTDNGCPPDQPPPATVVTEEGDVPLTGAWPTQSGRNREGFIFPARRNQTATDASISASLS